MKCGCQISTTTTGQRDRKEDKERRTKMIDYYIDRLLVSYLARWIDRQMNSHAYINVNGQIDRQMNSHAYINVHGQIDRQMNSHAYINVNGYIRQLSMYRRVPKKQRKILQNFLEKRKQTLV